MTSRGIWNVLIDNTRNPRWHWGVRVRVDLTMDFSTDQSKPGDGVFTTRVSLRQTTMFTYSQANTPLGQSERAYYLSYFKIICRDFWNISLAWQNWTRWTIISVKFQSFPILAILNYTSQKLNLVYYTNYWNLVFTKSVDSNFRAFWLAPVTRNILGYSLFCERREKWRVVLRKFQKKKLKKRFFIHLIW